MFADHAVEKTEHAAPLKNRYNALVHNKSAALAPAALAPLGALTCGGAIVSPCSGLAIITRRIMIASPYTSGGFYNTRYRASYQDCYYGKKALDLGVDATDCFWGND